MVINPRTATTRQQLARIRHRHLTCFLEIARTGKVGLAAQAMNISQPAASKTLRELEEILDATLFERGGKGGLQMTPAGRVFQRYAGASIAALREGLDGLARSRMAGELVLKIGALPEVAARIMPKVIGSFGQDNSVRLRVITAPNTAMLDQLRLGELSLVVGRLARPNQMQGLSFTHLYSEKLVCAVRADHPLIDRDSFDVATLQHMTILIPSKDGVVRPAVDRFLVANGLGALPHAIEARSTGFCRQFILDTDAIWIISRGVVEHDLQNGILGALNIDTSDTQGAVGLTVRADSDPSPTLRMMMDTIIRVAHEQTLTYPEYFSHPSD